MVIIIRSSLSQNEEIFFMSINELKGKRITVMGLGLHGGGVGTVRFLCEQGAIVIATDMKSKEELRDSVEKLKSYKNITYIFNQHRPEDFTNVDMVVKNPAVSWDNKYIKLAIEKKIPVEMDSSLFFKLCSNEIIGVTGTKGKTTTATLIYEILKSAGKSVIKVGIGQTSVLDKLKDLKKDTIVIFELSSWRLSVLGRAKLSPHVAVVTNIYPDHLNYYKSMKEYIADKKYICSNQKSADACVLNANDSVLSDWDEEIKSEVIRFSREKIGYSPSVYVDNGGIYINMGVEEKKVMDLDEIKLRGDHNISNILAAVSATRAMGLKISEIKKGVGNFKGIEHRLELVRELNEIKYYNDTAATTPDSAIAGLKSFSEPLVWIGGGSDKNLDMKDLARVALEKVKDAILLKGIGTDKLLEAMEKNNLGKHNFTVVDSMEAAVNLARAKAESGDVILLSPGAASFGLFINEFDRGNKFKEAVKNLR